MIRREKNNSIIFLTTLSVYLGLVLVGGTPSILAQTTGKIGKTQIVVRSEIYGDALLKFASQLEKLSEEGKFNWTEPIDLSYQFSYFERGKRVAFTSAGKKQPNKNLLQIIDKAAENISRNLSEFEDAFARRNDVFLSPFAISVSINQSDVTFKASRSDKENVDVFRNHFEKQAIAIENKPVAKIYENTRVSSENNQVFIVTRLPRGSLDELLKQNAKADNE